MASIYDQHDAAFARVEAYVILEDGARAATIAFKRPRDGDGRLYAYVHWLGVAMVRGHADGCGYDKRSAAVAVAAARLAPAFGVIEGTSRKKFRRAVEEEEDNGRHWDRRLEAAGFTVLQAV